MCFPRRLSVPPTDSRFGTGYGRPKQRDGTVRSELLLHLLPLSKTDFYVDTSGSPAVPFFSTESVFGKVFNVHYNSR